MTSFALRDFYHPTRDTDSTPQVQGIFRAQFPDLYKAAPKLKTVGGQALSLGGDTLVTYKSAVRKIFSKYFRQLDEATRHSIRSILERYSHTPEKNIRNWDEEAQHIVNNHQIGNMMPMPGGLPSMNTTRAAAPLYDYFDGFLGEVRTFYSKSTSYQPCDAAATGH